MLTKVEALEGRGPWMAGYSYAIEDILLYMTAGEIKKWQEIIMLNEDPTQAKMNEFITMLEDKFHTFFLTEIENNVL